MLVARGLSRATAARITRQAVERGILDRVDLVSGEDTRSKHPILFEGQVLAWINLGAHGAAEWRAKFRKKS